MTSKRVSVYVPDRLLPILGEGDSMSCRLAAVVDRYSVVVDQHTPELTRSEWCMILDACNGWATWSEAGETLMGGIALEVHDAFVVSMTADKWGMSQEQAIALVERLRGLTAAETIAVVERIERFWRRADLDTDAAMADAGIVPTEPVGGRIQKT